MSRAFVAFYMGDYQKKTQHLDTLQHGAYFLLLQHCWTHGAIPLEPAGRAAIARMTPLQWKKIAPTLNVFFDEEGRNKRATEEVDKAERVSTIRAMAGQKGGFASGRSKSKQIGSRPVAIAKQTTQQNGEQNPGTSIPIQKERLTTSSFDAARASAAAMAASAESPLVSALNEREARRKAEGSPMEEVKKSEDAA